MQSPQFMRRKQAGEYLLAKYGFGAEKTLAKLAVIGGGPEYQIAGRIPLYVPEDLDKWALAKISGPIRCTSEARSSHKAAPRHEAGGRGGSACSLHNSFSANAGARRSRRRGSRGGAPAVNIQTSNPATSGSICPMIWFTASRTTPRFFGR
jgi:hypothetical protein